MVRHSISSVHWCQLLFCHYQNVLIIRYITSDCDAVSIIHDDQGYAKSPEDAVVDVLKAGIGPTS